MCARLLVRAVANDDDDVDGGGSSRQIKLPEALASARATSASASVESKAARAAQVAAVAGAVLLTSSAAAAVAAALVVAVATTKAKEASSAYLEGESAPRGVHINHSTTSDVIRARALYFDDLRPCARSRVSSTLLSALAGTRARARASFPGNKRVRAGLLSCVRKLS